MRDCTEHAYAKLNLSLDVTARREDGYHDLAMLMQTVSTSGTWRSGPPCASWRP